MRIRPLSSTSDTNLRLDADFSMHVITEPNPPAALPIALATIVITMAVTSEPLRADPAQDQYAVAAGLYSQQRWDSAAEEFLAYLDDYGDHPKHSQGIFFLGEIRMQQGLHKQARSRFLEYLAAEPQGRFARPALFRAGEAAYLAHDPKAARPDLEKFSARFSEDPLNAFVLLYLGNMARDDGDPQIAETHYRQSLADFPQGKPRDECRLALAQALRNQGNHQQAQRLYMALASKTGSLLADDAQFHLASLLYADRRYAESLEAFGQFELTWPESPWRSTAQLGQGWALLKLDRLPEAESLFLSLASDAKVGTEARYWLGLTQKARSDYAAAAATLLEAVRRDPTHELAAALYFHAGESLLHAGDLEAADSQFGRAVAVEDPDKEWLDDALRGKIQTALRADDHQRLDTQVTVFLSRCQASPLEADVRRMSVRSLLERRQFDQAIEALGTLLAISPPSPTLVETRESLEDRFLLARCYEGLGRRPEALEALTPVLQSGSGLLLSEARLTRASLLVAMERFDEAIAPLEAFLSNEPSGESAVKASGLLAICQARTGRLDDAKRIFASLTEGRTSLADGPSVQRMAAELTEQLAEAAIDGGDVAWSAQLYNSLATEAPTPDAEARGLLGLGWSQYESGRPREAAATFERLLARRPDADLTGEAAMVRGAILAELGESDQALAMYELVLQQVPQSSRLADALYASARLHDRLEQYEQADARFDRLARSFPEFPQLDAVLYHRAWCLIELDRIPRAAELFDRIRADHPHSGYWAHATLPLAQWAFDADNYSRAETLLDELLATRSPAVAESTVGSDAENDSDNHNHSVASILDRVLYLEGQLRMATGRWPEARESYRRLLAEYPQSELRHQAAYGVAEAAFRMGDLDAAADGFTGLVDGRRDVGQAIGPLARLRLAQLHAQRRNWTDAFEIARRIAHEFPDFQRQYEADYVVGRCLASRADFRAARQAYQRVIDSPLGARTETAANAQLMIAESYHHQKNYADAHRAYSRLEILYDFPKLRAAALFQAAGCLELMDRSREAEALRDRLQREYPESEWARKAAESR